jgi:hypothetical protein
LAVFQADSLNGKAEFAGVRASAGSI